jgi:uncharacterized membrane protein YcjF (UPF0283 family)
MRGNEVMAASLLHHHFAGKNGVLGDDIMLAALYSQAVVNAYSSQQWVVLVAVLVPICVVVDAVFLILALGRTQK